MKKEEIMKKLWFVSMMLVLAMVLPARAAVLYQENFEDGVVNGLSDLYGYGWALETENGNSFIRYQYGSACCNDTLFITQTFQGNVSIEYSTRNNGRYEIGVTLVGSNWSLYWYTDIGYYSPYPVLGLYGHWFGQPLTNPNYPYIYPDPPVYGPFPLAYQWYDIKVTLINGITKFYVDGVLIDECDIGSLIPPILTEPFHFGWLTWGQRDIDNIVVQDVVIPVTIDVVDGKFWVGLKNSDDQGTQFDLRAELYVNDVLASQGETLCVTGVTRNPSYAKEVTVPFDPISDGTYNPGDVLSLRVLTRIGTNPDGSKCSGPGGSHNNAVGLRLYYDSPTRPSRFGAEISPDPLKDYFLHSASETYFLDDASPTGAVKYKDSSGVNYKNGNQWKEIGTWQMVLE
jgi:hypothetical protein